MLFPLIFNDNPLISKCWWQCNWAIFGCLHTIFMNKIPIYSPILKYGKRRMSLNQRINTRKLPFMQCVLWHLSPGDTLKIVICAHLTRPGWYTLYILIFAFCLIQRTSLLAMQWRHGKMLRSFLAIAIWRSHRVSRPPCFVTRILTSNAPGQWTLAPSQCLQWPSRDLKETSITLFNPCNNTSHCALYCFRGESVPNTNFRKWDVSYFGWSDRWMHYSDVIMSAMASQITSLTIVYSTSYSGANQRKHRSSK